MFSFSNKKKSDIVEDESIKDKSKFVVVGFAFMIFAFLFLIITEVYTSLSISNQQRIITSSNNIEDDSGKVLLEMSKVGKDIKEAEYSFITQIMKFKSPEEFQDFKNSISGIANQFNIQILNLNESAPVELKEKFSKYFINYQLLSTFENFTFFKNKISELPFNINVENETINRENPTSNKIIVDGVISVYVYEEKEKLLKKNEKLISEMKSKIEKEEADKNN